MQQNKFNATTNANNTQATRSKTYKKRNKKRATMKPLLFEISILKLFLSNALRLLES